MISTIFVGLLTTFGESLGMTTEQALLSSMWVFPSMIATSGEFIKALAQRVLCSSSEISESPTQQEVSSDRSPCQRFYTRK
jgi:hypothetical protein